MEGKRRLFTMDQVCGCILGGAVGDALGYPVEFCSQNEILRLYGNNGITRHELNREGLAEISDDTQMTLYTATGMLFASTRAHMRGIGGYPTDYMFRHYEDWYYSQTGDRHAGPGGSWISWDRRMRVRRAPGNTCLSAMAELLASGSLGFARNNSKGCGGVMRVAPVAVTNEYPDADDGMIATFASEMAAITHGHPLGTLPAAAFAMILRRIAIQNCPRNYNCFAGLIQKVAESLKDIRLYYYGPTYGEKFPVHTARFSSYLLRIIDLYGNPRTDAECIKELGEGWVADEALAIALFCALRHVDSFEDAVIAAVNHGGDSDSTGSICGNIMGLFAGEKEIPRHFLENLELRDLIEEVCDDIYYGCRISEYGSLDEISPNEAIEWERKYVHCVKDERDHGLNV